MKLKLVVVDLEMSPFTKRRLAVSAAVVAVAAMAGGAYAALPHTFASGETLTAANLNAALESLDARIAALEGRGLQVVGSLESSNEVTIPAAPAGFIPVPFTSAGDRMEIPVSVGGPNEVYLAIFNYRVSTGPGAGAVQAGKSAEVHVLDSTGNLAKRIWIDAAAPAPQDWGAAATAVITGLPAGSYTVQLNDYDWSSEDRTYVGVTRQFLLSRVN